MQKSIMGIYRGPGQMMLAAGLASALLFCGRTVQAADDSCPTKGVKELTGAGATFPFPLYSKMFDEYKDRDEVAAVHSMTSSARASREGGISMPSALAVFRLITS